jgi:hypothetical protein
MNSQHNPAPHPFVKIKAIFENGDSLTSGFNGTLDDARKYYLNQRFDMTRSWKEGSPEVFVKCVAVEEIK